MRIIGGGQGWLEVCVPDRWNNAQVERAVNSAVPSTARGWKMSPAERPCGCPKRADRKHYTVKAEESSRWPSVSTAHQTSAPSTTR